MTDAATQIGLRKLVQTLELTGVITREDIAAYLFGLEAEQQRADEAKNPKLAKELGALVTTIAADNEIDWQA